MYLAAGQPLTPNNPERLTKGHATFKAFIIIRTSNHQNALGQPLRNILEGGGGTALAAGISTWKLPTSVTPSHSVPPMSQIFIVKGLQAPQHYQLIVNGQVWFLQNIGWQRINVELRNPGPRQVGQPRHLPQSLPHLLLCLLQLPDRK